MFLLSRHVCLLAAREWLTTTARQATYSHWRRRASGQFVIFVEDVDAVRAELDQHQVGGTQRSCGP